MEGLVDVVARRRSAGVGPRAEQLQRLVLGRGGKRHKGDAAESGLHLQRQQVFGADLAAVG